MRTYGIVWALIGVVLVGGTARAEGPVGGDLWSEPDGAAAWWVFDPGVLGPNEASDPARAMAEAGLRALLSRVMPVEGAPPVLPTDLVSPGVLGASPYRLCLMDIEAAEAAGKPGPDRAAPLSKLAAVLEVRRPQPHEDLLGILRAKLGGGAGAEKPIDLPGGLKGTQIGEGTRAVSWCSKPGSLVVGFGSGAIERWLGAPELAAQSEAKAERAQITSARAGGTPVFEAYVDLNALRRAAPEQFAYGRIGRLAGAWRLANARSFMASARLMPPAEGRPRLLGMDVAFASRAESPGVVHAMPVSDGSWPAEAGPVDAAPYAAIVRADWVGWMTTSLDTWAAVSPGGGAPERAAAERWQRAHHAALERILGQAGARCVIRGGAGGLALEATLMPAPHRQRLDLALRDVWGSIAKEIALDPAMPVWSLTLDETHADPDHLLRRFFWGVRADGLAFVGAWSREPVERAVTTGH